MNTEKPTVTDSRNLASETEANLAKALRELLEVTKPYWVLPQVKRQYDFARAALKNYDAHLFFEASRKQ